LIEEQEINDIKNQKLGLNKEKRRLQKPSEKFRNNFNFEWDASEDTSVDTNPLYAHRQSANLLFGKGTIAGFDQQEQEKRTIEYEDAVRKARNMSEEPNGEQKPDGERRHKRLELGHTKHWSEKPLSDMTERDWRILREDHEIIIKGGRVPPPVRSWDEAKLPSFIMKAIKELEYKKPTSIQMQAIPVGNLRRDLIGLAPTGSGKTVAFLLPIIAYLNTLPPINNDTAEDGPYGLIITPTRELANQIHADFVKLTAHTRLRSTVIVGGKSIEEQAFNIRKGIELLVSTPGRLKDALESRYLVLNQCSYVVIDEADRLMEMGFEETLEYILDAIPATNLKSDREDLAELQEQKAQQGEVTYRITHMFSATMPSQVEKIARRYLRCPSYISIGEPGVGKKDIDQIVEFLTEGEKKHRLKFYMDRAEPPIIVFLNEKRAVEILAKTIENWGWKPVIYHGGRSQEQREAAIEGFKSKKYDVLVTTDLGQRGLDVEGVKYVINFDAPKDISSFVHRTGRTGRAGKKGTAITFLTGKNEELFFDLKNFLTQNGQTVPEELADHPATKVKPGTVDAVPRRKQVIYAQ